MNEFPSRERRLYDALERRLEGLSETHPDHEEILEWKDNNHAWLAERWNEYLESVGIIVVDRGATVPEGYELVSNPLYTTKTDLFVSSDVADRILAIGLP